MLKRMAMAWLAVSAPLALADEPATPAAAAPTAEERTGGELGLDPNYSRLLFSPTGRPLKKGDGYFSDYELMFPGVAVGVTDNLSVAGGLSVIPGIRMDKQLFYVSPRIGWDLGKKAAVSVGALYATFPEDDDALAIGFAVGTFGDRYKSLSVGLGVGDEYLDDGFDGTPIMMIGGTLTLSRHVALVSENWLVLDDDFDFGYQPFGVGVRFFGDKLSADVGLVLVPELVATGSFLPWASISYHFGPSNGPRSQRSR